MVKEQRSRSGTGMVEEFLREELPGVMHPSRYIGREVNFQLKEFDRVPVRLALAYPDLYEIGVSNLGLAILYEIINQRDDALAERVYLPWVDMQERLLCRGVPLFSLESRRPLREFDVVGITLQHELTYSNVLRLLELAGIPLLSRERGEGDPLVIAGGPGAYNPEPLAEVFDLIVLGDGEEVISELIDEIVVSKREGLGKEEILRRCLGVSGVYVPSFYHPVYDERGRVREIAVDEGAPYPVEKRVVMDLDRYSLPRHPLVPYVEAVHDRCNIELFRGCTQGCRFCQAGMIYRPVRERSIEALSAWGREALRNTGYEELSLASLSSADYTQILQLADRFLEELRGRGISLSLPSLRTDNFSIELASRLNAVRRMGLTFAPEAGSERLRKAINKNLSDEDLIATLEAAEMAGWKRVKLYFMIGLPGERDEDLGDIIRLVKRVAGKKEGRFKTMRFAISLSTFVPKPHTPFQWVAQLSIPETIRRQRLIRENLHLRRVELRWHQAEMSYLEGVLSRGDRRLLPAIVAASRKGCFDNWSEMFSYERWRESLEEAGLDPTFYVERERDEDEFFPWEHLHAGVTRDFLWSEYEKSLEGVLTPDCRFRDCLQCGACSRPEVHILLMEGCKGRGT